MDQDKKIEEDLGADLATTGIPAGWSSPEAVKLIIVRWCWKNRGLGFPFSKEPLKIPDELSNSLTKISQCLHTKKELIRKNLKNNPNVDPIDVLLSTVANDINNCLAQSIICVETKKPEELKTRKNLLLKINPSLPFENVGAIKLDSKNPAFLELEQIIKSSVRGKKLEIRQVVNPYLWTLYNLKKLHLKELYGKEPVERILFHGTSKKSAKQISQTNFDHRLSASNDGTVYGHGVYFTEKFIIAANYTNKSERFQFVMCCRVLYVKSHVGDEETFVPNAGSDTTRTDNKIIYVKFDDDVFYPEYRIRFAL